MPRAVKAGESIYNIHLINETLQSMNGELEAFRNWLSKRTKVDLSQDVKGFIDSIAKRNHVLVREINKVARMQQNMRHEPLVDVDIVLQAQVLANIQQLLSNKQLQIKLGEAQRGLWGDLQTALEKIENHVGKVRTHVKVERVNFERLE